jgi:hypothetical protein
VRVEFTAPPGANPTELLLTVYPEQFAYTAPSPPTVFATRTVAVGTVSLGPKDMPARAMVRYSGTGIGTGYVCLAAGDGPTPIELRAPDRLRGRAGALVFWCTPQAWLPGLSPRAAVRIVGMGGGEHGVPLAEADSDERGWFELAGFDAGLPGLGVRALLGGHALGWVDWQRGGPLPVVAMLPAFPIRGRVTAEPGVLALPLQLLAKGLPGLVTDVRPDGTFVLEHVPPRASLRLLVSGLPATHTHAETRAEPGSRGVEIRITRAGSIAGAVVDRYSQAPLAGAYVWHRHGPAGTVMVQTDTGGRFLLERVPPGVIEIGAQWTQRAVAGAPERVRATSSRYRVTEGQRLEHVLLVID